MLPHLALRLAPPEIAFAEVVHVGGMDGPVVTLAVSAAARLDEAVVEGQVVPDRVSPAGSAGPKVGVVVQDVLVDVRKHQFALGRAENGHGDEADVAVLGLGLLGLERPGEERVAGQRCRKGIQQRVSQPLGDGILVQLESVLIDGQKSPGTVLQSEGNGQPRRGVRRSLVAAHLNHCTTSTHRSQTG